MGDAASFEKSDLNREVREDYKLGDNNDGGTIHRLLHKGIILGDAAFPLLMWLLPPFKNLLNHRAAANAAVRDRMNVYNYRHSSGRMIKEQAFGLLKNRWKILQDGRYHRSLAALPGTLNACLGLHNFLLEVESKHYKGTEEEEQQWADAFRAEHLQDVPMRPTCILNLPRPRCINLPSPSEI